LKIKNDKIKRIIDGSEPILSTKQMELNMTKKLDYILYPCSNYDATPISVLSDTCKNFIYIDQEFKAGDHTECFHKYVQNILQGSQVQLDGYFVRGLYSPRDSEIRDTHAHRANGKLTTEFCALIQEVFDRRNYSCLILSKDRNEVDAAAMITVVLLKGDAVEAIEHLWNKKSQDRMNCLGLSYILPGTACGGCKLEVPGQIEQLMLKSTPEYLLHDGSLFDKEDNQAMMRKLEDKFGDPISNHSKMYGKDIIQLRKKKE
jgi:hypothetical protein